MRDGVKLFTAVFCRGIRDEISPDDEADAVLGRTLRRR